MINIGFDVFGGDNSPNAAVAAAVKFAKENGDVKITLYGKEAIINDLISEEISNIEIVNATEKIEGNDEPTIAIRRKKDSSMVIGANALKNCEVDCLLSAGNTGALVAAGVFIVRRIKGIDRPALPGLMPSTNRNKPVMLLDLGANIEAKEEHLMQYAKMANIYMQSILQVKEPEVGLLNIGAEENKGTDLYKNTYQNLSASELKFVGNIEARDILTTKHDIIVMDGFTGNMVLKTLEGSIALFNDTLKSVFLANIKTKIGALLVKSRLKSFKENMDYKEIGATPILGLNKLVLKAHGSSDERAFYSALKSAKVMIEADLINEMKRGLENE